MSKRKIVKSSHYRLLGLVGEGQFGKVYTAIHRQTGELVALKELSPRKFSTKNFLREIRILLTLGHPNIIRCQGVEHTEGKRYLVTEYCEGGNLRDLIESDYVLTLEENIKIVADILAGLNHAHHEGIIHRDIKPENILLSLDNKGWQVKISDFGVAKTVEEDGKTGNFSLGDTGSPAYMSPEQFYGKYNASSDLYAVGVILAELLTGDRPFNGSPQEIMIGHLNKTPEIPDFLPQSLQTIIAQSLAKLPQHRYRTASDMRKTLLNSLLDLDSKKNSRPSLTFTNTISLDLIKKIHLKQDYKFLISFQNKIFLTNESTIDYAKYKIEQSEKKLTLFDGNKIDISQSIMATHGSEKNVIITTNKKSLDNKYELISIYPENKSLIHLSAYGNLVYAIAPNQTWIAFVKQESTEKVGFQIINLKTLKPINLLIEDFLPRQLLALDNNHGLAIYNQENIDKNSTSFRFFTRRGTWADSYNFTINLQHITHNKFNSNYFLSQEKFTKNVVLIEVKPLKLTRVKLKFSPEFIIPLPHKFLCANQTGEISLIDFNGKCLANIHLPEKIQAINYLRNNIIAILTQSLGNSYLNFYHIH